MADSKDPKVQEKVAEHLADLTEKLTKKTMDLLVAQNKNVRNVEKETRVKEKQIKAAQRLIDTEVSIQEAKEDLALTQTKEWKENLKLQREAKKFQEKAREARKDYRQELKDSIMEPFRAVKDAIPKPVQILTAWGLRGAKNMTANVLSTARKSMASMWKGMGKVLGSGPKQLDLFGGPPTPVGTKSEPLEELHAKKIVIEGQQDLFSKEEEKREEGRADKAEKKREGMLSRMMGAGKSGVSKATGFLKGMFGGGAGKFLRVFAPLAALITPFLMPILGFTLLALIGAGLFWLAVNKDKVVKFIKESPKVQKMLKGVESIAETVFGTILDLIIQSLHNAALRSLGITPQTRTPDQKKKLTEDKKRLGRNPDSLTEEMMEEVAKGAGMPTAATKFEKEVRAKNLTLEVLFEHMKEMTSHLGRREARRRVWMGTPDQSEITKKKHDQIVGRLQGEIEKKEARLADFEAARKAKEAEDMPGDRAGQMKRNEALARIAKQQVLTQNALNLLKGWQEKFQEVFPKDSLKGSPSHLTKAGAVGKPLNDWLPKLGPISTVLSGIFNLLLGAPAAWGAGLDTHNMNVAHSKFTKQRTPAQEALMELLRQGETGAHGGYDALNISKKGHFSRTLWETNQGRIVRDPSQLRDGEMWTTMQPRNTALAPGEDGSWQAAGGKRITEMTLEEIMTAQAARKMMHVGAYQIAPKTMTGIMDNIARDQGGGAQGAQYVEQLKKMKFGKSMQDRFARRLMNSAIRKYRLGLWDKKQTIDELGNIWGAIPAVGGGSLLPGHQSPSLDRSEIGDFLDRIVGRPSQETVRGMSLQNRLALGFGRDLVQGQQQLSLAETILRSQSRSQFGSNQIVMSPQTDASVTNINLAQKTVTNPHGHKFHNTTVVWT